MKNKRILRNRYFLLIDILLVFLTYAAAIALVFPIREVFGKYHDGIHLILLTAVLYIAAMFAVRAYYIDIGKAGPTEYARVFLGCAAAAIASVVVGLYVSKTAIFPKLNIMVNVVLVIMFFSVRIAIKTLQKLIIGYSREKGKNVLVIGAGSLANLLLKDIEENPVLNYNVIGMIDDNPAKRRLIIHGAKVLGTRNDIERICADKNVDEIIFAIYSIESSEKRAILDICSRTGKKLKILPGFEAFLTGAGRGVSGIRDVAIEDLLGRDCVKLDNKLIGEDISGKCVLVTGGGGSIGSELCRQIIKYNPARLIILDIYENTTYELQNELSEKYPNQKLDVLIASVRDKQRLNAIFEQYRPDIVFHAAAHKHVPLMEDSPGEAIKNNVFGTYNTAVCANEYGAKRFVMISTDKAVNPTNIMGASKRMCEMIVQTLQKTCKTEYVAVRFGNVLGSNGSVVPRFRKQIESGGPVTVTHPEITRYFMTIPEAAQLVLQAAAYAKGGEIFVLDMGEPVKIYDLAKKMISLSGLRPNVDIKIEFTGLRPGEKLYEELLMGEEGLQKTAHSKIFIGKPIDLTPEELLEKLKLLESSLSGDTEEISQAIKKAVPTYVIPQIMA
ncbi:MAG: polysaccharide biosynthesis protein [Clostridia bacterium]|nr:polysaccharide biosynthesis protein [Clostridia bacterium]